MLSSSRFQKPHFTRRAFDDPGMFHALDGDTPCSGEVVGDSILSLTHAVLLEPGDGKTCFGIELTLDATEIFVELGIDQLQGGLHRHRAVISLKNRLVSARTRPCLGDGRLRHVGWSDVGGLKLGNRRGQIRRLRERMNSARVIVPADASLGRQTRTTELASAFFSSSNQPTRALGTDWPGANNCISSSKNRGKECCPSGRAYSSPSQLRFA